MRGGHLRGTLRLRDPGAHLLFTSLRFDRLRLICQGLRVDGLGQIGHRRMPFSVIAAAGRRTMTLDIAVAIPGLGYRLSGAVHGHLTLRLPRQPGVAHRTRRPRRVRTKGSTQNRSAHRTRLR